MSVLVEVAGRMSRTGLQVVSVTGEAGIGKTTLIAGFARDHCLPLGWTVLYGRCDEFVREPFQPFRGIVGRLLDDLPADELIAHTASCGGGLLTLAPQLQQLVPTLTGDRPGDQRTARHLLFEAVGDIVRRASATAPLVLVFDDLHWAEPTGLQLLVHLVRQLAGSPVVFVVSHRDASHATDGHFRAAVADLIRCGAVRVELRVFDQLALGDLVRVRLGASTTDDVETVAQ